MATANKKSLISANDWKKSPEARLLLKDLENNLVACQAGSEEILAELMELRRGIRQALLENGIPSNPGWTNQCIVDGVRRIAGVVLAKISGNEK